MKEILSTKNDFIKKLKKLHKRKGREEAQQYLLEGFHLVEEAVAFSAELTCILYDDRGRREWGPWLDQQEPERLIFVSGEVMKSLSQLPTPQGIVGVVNMAASHEIDSFRGHWLALDQVQDPGNVGTMIRTADAAGYSGVIVGEGSADIYSAKVLRAMQGSHFHLPIIRRSLEEVIPVFLEAGVSVLGTQLDAQALHYTDLKPAAETCLLMGNEGSGVRPELLERATQNVYIPIRGKAESLNVAVAAGILMYHLTNQ